MLVVLCAGAFNACAQGQQPDYSNVNDILGGRRTLVAVNDVAIGGLVFKTSDGTKIDDKNIYNLPDFKIHTSDPQILARMFDSTYDTLVYAQANTLYAIDPISKTTKSLKLEGDEFSLAGFATGDFKGDGLQEIVIASLSGIRVVSAVDPKDFSKGIQSGPFSIIDTEGSYRAAVAVGDFDGDGRLEVAVAYDRFYSEAQGRLSIYKVDPKTLELQLKHAEPLTEVLTSGIFLASAAAGRFGTTLHDQLIVGYRIASSNGPDPQDVQLKSFDFDTSLKPILKHTFNTGLKNGPELILEAGRFNFNSPFEQVAMKWTQGRDNVQLGILTFDNTLKIRYPKFIVLSGIACSSGLSVGNFARTEPDPQDPSKTQLSFKLQLAISSSNCQGSMGLNIYNVDVPNKPGGDFVINPNQVFGNHMIDPNRTKYYGLPIVAGDIQGRSFIVGEPTKVVVQKTAQPSVIAAMPPMHVDFIPPVGSKEPDVLNLSAIPDGFRTVYETNETEGNQSSTINTTSWSFGAKQSFEFEYEFGDVEEGLGVKFASTTRAAQDLKGVTEEEHGSYEKADFSAFVKTGLADQVWYTSSRFNIYVYPVIGRTVCPAAKPQCLDSERLPLTIQFSAPDKIEYNKTDGNLIPWYQPPWEPGNVFSYPATFDQLEEIVPNLELLSKAQTSRTDTSTATERATWTKETTHGATSSFDQNYSFEQEFSVAGAWGTVFTTTTVTGTLNLSGSFGFSDLSKSVTTVGRSAGIGVEKPGTFRTPPSYNYPFTPYILGSKKPASAVDDIPLDTDVKTFGLLRTAFVADPARDDAGSWWRKAYTSAPDVALNHPSRWHWRQVAVENPIPINCLNVGFGGTNMDCLDFSTPRLDDLWDSNFHVMRGFFISSALNPGKGPQLTTATAGDKLTLQTRVYNYSFTAMPPDAGVHVRFYVQPLDKDKHTFVGDSVLVNNEDVVLSPIPPFSDDDKAPLNWVLASTTFDTTPYENKYLVFWVMVWMEDSGGRLVPEIGSHGLKSVPGTLKSPADVPIEDYSNNVGFYNAEFYVFPKESVLAASSRNGEPAAVDIGKMQLSAKRLAPGQIIDVSAELSAAHKSASGVTAVFYEGDPHAGGTAFGLERSPYIAENDTYEVKAPYYAKTCGAHELFIVINKDTPDEILRRSSPVIIDCARAFNPFAH
jgi:FG-GAP-like repeat